MGLSTSRRALAGGALIGLAAALALATHGRIAGISGTLARAFAADGGRGSACRSSPACWWSA